MNKRGFTILEILATLAIISILGSFATIQVQKTLSTIKETSCYNRMKIIAISEKRFFVTKGRHSAEFINGTLIDSSSELVKRNYYIWHHDDCSGDFIWSINIDGDYELSCSYHTEQVVVQSPEEYRNDLFVDFPDDGITIGGGVPYDDGDGTTPADDTVIGTVGDDVIESDKGDDIVDGGIGDDIIDGEAGNDELYGGAGSDIIDGGIGDDIIYGGTGDDEADGGNSEDILFGGEGADSLYGGNGKDQLDGGIGDDYIEGGNGDDTLTGGTGNDIINGGDHTGGTGNDTAVFIYPYQEYSMNYISVFEYTISHPIEGNDTLLYITFLDFSDITKVRIEDAYLLIAQ